MVNDDLILVHADWNPQSFIAVEEEEEEKINEDIA